MGLSASQGRMLLLTARKSDLEFRAQQISQKRLLLSQQLEEVALDYEEATSNRKMSIRLYLNGEASDNENVTQTSNLTYASLISGTRNMSPVDSGLKPLELYDTEYASTTPYRLVDAYGAIVVSSEEEISTYQETKSSTNTTADENGIYKPGTHKDSGAAKHELIGEASNYIVAGGDLATFFNDDKNSDISKKNIVLDSKNGMIKIADPENEGKFLYFNTKDGSRVTEQARIDEFSQKNGETTSVAMDVADVPQTTLITSSTSGNEIVEGADGKYTVKDADGNVIARYIVDPTLANGTTDVAGDKNGPNYLQDCLRNGKYLIEKATVNPDTNKYQWRGISWDTTANIFDGYYTDDDDKAKAKYDRLQTQIQAQDKKLELELDNVETQRSAVTTEMESVKKVIQENIEGSFNAFG